MTKKEIFDIEKNNINKIELFLEGIFWRAYEESAFRFVKHIRPFKATRKMIKLLGAELVYLGFPQTNLKNIIDNSKVKIINESEKRISLELLCEDGYTKEEYIEWKNQVPVSVVNINSNKPILQDDNKAVNKDNNIVSLIKEFQLESKTPIDCFIFISELKKIINLNAI